MTAVGPRPARGLAPAVALAALSLACGAPGGPPPEAGYRPGLGEIMASVQWRHIKLHAAGAARNWPLAAHEVHELEEAFEDAARYHPRFRRLPLPLGELVARHTAAPLEALRAAIDRGDGASFEAAYDALTRGCNECHAAAGMPFLVMIRPAGHPFSDQRFEPGH